MIRSLNTIVWSTAALLLLATSLVMAAPAELLRINLADDDCCTTCPRCQHRCQLEVKETKEKKECFQVECRTICIPRIRLPWQRCNEPQCAEARTVKVLKTHSYECPKCEYVWSVVACEPAASSPAPAVEESAAPAEVPVPEPAVPTANRGAELSSRRR